MNALLVAGVLPIVTVTLGTAAFRNELKNDTRANLTLIPLPQ